MALFSRLSMIPTESNKKTPAPSQNLLRIDMLIILECCNLFYGVELSIRSFCYIFDYLFYTLLYGNLCA